MISCDEYQRKIVAVLDHESSDEDEKLLSDHLTDCHECRAFYDEVIRTRQFFSIATAVKTTVTIGQKFMRTVVADAQQSKGRPCKSQTNNQTQSRKDFSRLFWVGRAAAAVMILVSWLACYLLANEVADLRGQLQDTKQRLAVAQAEMQVKEAQGNQQKVISELHVRVKELEGHVQRGISPRTAWQSESPYYRPEHPGKL